MFWADKLLENVKGKQLINDSWTPSGNIHIGSLKGPVIHDVLYKSLKSRKEEVKFIYGFDDADPIDGLPPYLIATHEKYLGMPLYAAPSPEGEGSFADYFSNKMKHLLDSLDIMPEIYKTSVLYKNGTFDNAITFVLDHAAEIRKVYGEIYHKEISGDWYPLQVVCPKCGKLGTTQVTAWDSKEVSFSCIENLVKWSNGCGYSGKISPFKGNAKMPWKVEWAAKWWTFGVTIEGAGKDHASAGGSYDVAMKICSDVFKKQKPLKFAYEFFLSGGKKMASSKGIGITGEQLLEVLTPQVARFLMIKSPPNQAIEFTPRGTDLIPKIYDDYQKASDVYLANNGEDPAKIFEYSQVGKIEKPPRIRFSVLAQWIQMPNMVKEISKESLDGWVKYAKIWIEDYAPETEKFLIQKETPRGVKELTPKQKKYLEKLQKLLDKTISAEELQTKIYDTAKELDLSSKEAFAAIYIAFLGKNHGPKAAWLLSSLDCDFVKKRLEEASSI